MSDAPDRPLPADPYRSPAARVGESPRGMSPWVTWLCIGASLSVAPVVLIVPQFRDVFANFGAELPWPTRLLVDAPWVVFAWPALVAGLAARWRRRRDRSLALILVAVLGTFAVFGIVVATMYLPIFKLAATI